MLCTTGRIRKLPRANLQRSRVIVRAANANRNARNENDPPSRPARRIHHRGDFQPTKIDRWFLVQIKEIVDFEEELATAKN